MRVALNGFGRIAKNIMRIWSAYEKPSWHIGMIHTGSGDPEMIPYALTYDTTMGRDEYVEWSYDSDSGMLKTPHGLVTILPGKDVTDGLWQQHDIHTIIDASGAYTQKERAQEHIKIGGARRVVVTAPMDNPDATVILGYNTEQLASGSIMSLASCTTNATVPLIAMLEQWGLQQVSVSTLHAYTHSQSLLDTYPSSKDPRRYRAAPDNIVPTSTGADQAIVQVMPHMAGRVRARSYRVPVNNVSLVEVLGVVQDPPAHQQAFYDGMQEYLSHNTYASAILDPVVSSDLKGTYASVYLDVPLCDVDGSLVLLAGWYDNEWAYAYRVCEAMDLLAG